MEHPFAGLLKAIAEGKAIECRDPNSDHIPWRVTSPQKIFEDLASGTRQVIWRLAPQQMTFAGHQFCVPVPGSTGNNLFIYGVGSGNKMIEFPDKESAVRLTRLLEETFKVTV